MLLLQDSAQLATWSDQAVRDTIAKIARSPEYQRSIKDSLMSQLFRWIGDQINDFLRFVSNSSNGRLIVTVLVLLGVALIVARVVIGIRAERLQGRITGPRHISAARTIQLADAERLAAMGDYTAAAHALFASLLTAGAARGEFRVHPSKTTGDYVSELRRRKAGWFRPFQSFRSRYDRVIYGDMQCSADDYQALMTDVRQMMTAG